MGNHTSINDQTNTPINRLVAWFRQQAEEIWARSERLLALTFALLILLGTLLLWLPVSHARVGITFLDAFFTATSAVCVTGLVVVDTGKDFTPFGQGVILCLFQLGGLGIMTFAAVATQVLGGKLSFRSQAALSSTFYQDNVGAYLRYDLKRIVAMTLSFEAIGSAVIFFRIQNNPSDHDSLFTSMFHAVSAFCNAGFSLHADSVTRYRSDPAVMITIMALIIVGGLGHTVVLEGLRRLRNRILKRPTSPLMWSLNSRIVLWMSGGLILLGAILLMLLGVGAHRESWIEGLADALFQSVTCRTAGFNTVDVGQLPRTALLVMAVLMFIGGSPASCAGGVKTTSIATWYAQLWAWMRGQRDVTLLGRRLPREVVARAAMIIGLALVWNAIGCLLLTALESGKSPIPFENLLFEQASAFGTVGLSTGITASLSAASKLWIILSMFVGRLGPLTFAMVISARESSHIRYPEEHLMVG